MEINSIAVKRIKNELRDVAKSKCGISIEVLNDNLGDLKGKISGPPDTPYEGGEFILDMKIPPGYPFTPLKVKFVTKIWHPNISVFNGWICLDTLYRAWTPSMTLRTVLLSIQALLQDPEPDYPINHAAANQLIANPEMYKLTGKYFGQVFAGVPGSIVDFDDKVKILKDMGADEEKALLILALCSWNLESALKEQF